MGTAPPRSGSTWLDPAHDKVGRPREATYFGTLLNIVAISLSWPPSRYASERRRFVGPPAKQKGVGALVRGTDLRPGDLVQQLRLPAAEREPHRAFVGVAGCLCDQVWASDAHRLGTEVDVAIL